MKAGQRTEWPVLWTALGALAMLMIGFGAAWAWLQHAERQRVTSSFTMLKPLAVSGSGHSVGATLAVKTSEADKRWAGQNRAGLEAALQQALLGADPARALAPNGLVELQHSLRQVANGSLSTDKIQEIVITDFLVTVY
ncbi:MAG TPA: hypothetical protein VM406_07335 [Noviherbaspirillum sp.]|nr:hypothetical protein [Noviherbaspirillum sp.]